MGRVARELVNDVKDMTAANLKKKTASSIIRFSNTKKNDGLP